MEEDVLNALQTRTVYLPGGFDRNGKVIFIVNIVNDLQSWQRKCLELSVTYLKRSLSDLILQKGLTIIVDAQKDTARISRQHARFIYGLFRGLNITLYLVKSEGFWEKHVETCTKSYTKEEPIILSKARLTKFFDMHNLPEELGGSLQFNYDLWLQQRKIIDEFEKCYNNTLTAMENLQLLLQSSKSTLRPTEADAELKKCAQVQATVHNSIEATMDLGNRILTRFNEIYAPTPPLTSAIIAPTAITHLTSNELATNLTASTQVRALMKRNLPLDLNCERSRIELRLNDIEKRQTELRNLWLELMQIVREGRELSSLEEGVAFVTNWILNTAEQLLNRQHTIGCDVKACEQLRTAHNVLEMECRETYGFYGELLYKIDTYNGCKDGLAYRDLISQRDFMQFVCRSFASRLERRRNMLITSLRFYRLVNEYFERTTQVFESLVMDNKMEDFTKAAASLKKLKDSQQSLVSIERELIKEGEKLSDMLSMPVKDALGRDLHIDYSDDICNVREILETTLARRKIFSDSVELQKLTLEQVTHIQAYEEDSRMAIKWLDDLYNVMIRCHTHVGCNIYEIQVQKDELQTFQKTGKSIYNYGCQLLEASQALRGTCKLSLSDAVQMQEELQHTWHSLQSISQEHMTRLRVSAVFHRSVEDYCQQLMELKRSLLRFFNKQQEQLQQQQQKEQHPTQIRQQRHTEQHQHQQRSSSSGISSESDSQPSFDGIMPALTTPSLSSSQCNTGQCAGSADVLPDHSKMLNEQRDQLRKHLIEREQLLLEVGRMVRLGRLLKTRLKEPFILDAATGKSIIIEDLPSEMSTSSPIVDSVSASSSSGCSSSGSISNSSVDASKVVIKPIANNSLACNAISAKLTEIAEVAESLDTVIRDIQDNALCMELESSDGSADKKVGTPRSNSSEDWHSRSTEDDSFVTASEGNFTPFSQSSSSYRTASGRTTSSFVSCDKNSFDADDATFVYEMPELTSPLNTSFESSEQSYVSAQNRQTQTTIRLSKEKSEKSAITFTDNSSQTLNELSDKQEVTVNAIELDEQNIIAINENLRSESITPTLEQRKEIDNLLENASIESEAELEISAIADAPSMAALGEIRPLTSVTPEVSLCSIHSSVVDEPHVQIQQQRSNKPNANWRRSKYYENITKQTIKGFL